MLITCVCVVSDVNADRLLLVDFVIYLIYIFFGGLEIVMQVEFWIDLVLTLLGYIPGIIYAIYVLVGWYLNCLDFILCTFSFYYFICISFSLKTVSKFYLRLMDMQLELSTFKCVRWSSSQQRLVAKKLWLWIAIDFVT